MKIASWIFFFVYYSCVNVPGAYNCDTRYEIAGQWPTEKLCNVARDAAREENDFTGLNILTPCQDANLPPPDIDWEAYVFWLSKREVLIATDLW